MNARHVTHVGGSTKRYVCVITILGTITANTPGVPDRHLGQLFCTHRIPYEPPGEIIMNCSRTPDIIARSVTRTQKYKIDIPKYIRERIYV